MIYGRGIDDRLTVQKGIKGTVSLTITEGKTSKTIVVDVFNLIKLLEKTK